MAVWWLGGAISVGILALVNVHTLNVICVGAAGFCILGGAKRAEQFHRGIL